MPTTSDSNTKSNTKDFLVCCDILLQHFIMKHICNLGTCSITAKSRLYILLPLSQVFCLKMPFQIKFANNSQSVRTNRVHQKGIFIKQLP